MSYNIEQANAALDGILALAATDNNAAKAQFANLIQNLNVYATGSVTVLYAGSVNGTPSGDIVKGLIAENPDAVRALDKTAASKFLAGATATDIDNKNFKLIETLTTVFA